MKTINVSGTKLLLLNVSQCKLPRCDNHIYVSRKAWPAVFQYNTRNVRLANT